MPAAPVPTMRTERLLLRPARESDLDALYAIMRDPRAMAYWSTLPHETREVTRQWLAAMIASPPGEGEDFVVEFEGQVIGKCGAYRFPEFGFIFHPDVWGRGFAFEAMRPVIDRAFAVHRLPRLVADVDPRNAASLKLLGRLGFERTGFRKDTFLIGDQWCDSVYLGLEADAWWARQSAPHEPG